MTDICIYRFKKRLTLSDWNAALLYHTVQRLYILSYEQKKTNQGRFM